MKKTFLLIVILFIGSVYPQEISVPEKLKKLTDDSFKNYPKLKEMNGLVTLSDAKVEMAKAGYLPIAKVDASYMTLDPISKISIPMGAQSKEFPTLPNDNYSAMLNILQPVIDFKTSTNVNKALSEVTVSTDNLKSFKTQLAYQIAQIYYGIIYLNQSINVQQLQLTLIKANLALITAKIKSGDALKYDLVSTQVRYTNVDNYYTELTNQLHKQYNNLNMLTGNTGSGYIADTSINFTYFDLKADSIFAITERDNHELILARDKIESSNWDITSAEKSMLPSLSFQLGLGYKNGILPDMNDIRFNYSAVVGLTVPILSASRPSIQKEMAIVALENSKNALEAQRITISKDVLNTIDDIKKNTQKLNSVDALIEQAHMALDLATERYKEGVITNLDLLTAQTNYQDAQLNKLQVEYSLLLSKIELNRLSGRIWW